MFEQEFERLLSGYRDAIDQRARFSGLVKDFFPGQQMQINLILSAYDLGIAKDIQAAAQINNAFAYRFVKRLMEEYGISRVNADWVISIWCVCYGQHILKKPYEIKISAGKGGGAPAIKEEKTGTISYGDLFSYERDSSGRGYAVNGFRGTNTRTIIFQNTYNHLPVIEIKAEAFSESDVEEAIMTEGIARIANRAFCGCTKLRQVIFPVSMKEFGDYAFAGCGSLSTASLPPMLEQIGAYALSGTAIKNIHFPETLYWIGEGAMAQCKLISKVEIPDNIGEIPAKMFMGCDNLTKVQLHEKLTAIGEFAFADCINLDSIYIPDSVTAIGDGAFDHVHDKFILMCSFGSYAESYARKKKLKYQLV
jgi:hypothetical protein